MMHKTNFKLQENFLNFNNKNYNMNELYIFGDYVMETVEALKVINVTLINKYYLSKLRRQTVLFLDLK